MLGTLGSATEFPNVVRPDTCLVHSVALPSVRSLPSAVSVRSTVPSTVFDHTALRTLGSTTECTNTVPCIWPYAIPRVYQLRPNAGYCIGTAWDGVRPNAGYCIGTLGSTTECTKRCVVAHSASYRGHSGQIQPQCLVHSEYVVRPDTCLVHSVVLPMLSGQIRAWYTR